MLKVFIGMLGGFAIGATCGHLFGLYGLILTVPLSLGWGYFCAKTIPY